MASRSRGDSVIVQPLAFSLVCSRRRMLAASVGRSDGWRVDRKDYEQQSALLCSLFGLGITVRMSLVLLERSTQCRKPEEAWPLMRIELVGRERELAALVEHPSRLLPEIRVLCCAGVSRGSARPGWQRS
jgi:hypothetical protein